MQITTVALVVNIFAILLMCLSFVLVKLANIASSKSCSKPYYKPLFWVGIFLSVVSLVL